MKREVDGVIIDDNRKEFRFEIETPSGVKLFATMADDEKSARQIVDRFLAEEKIA